LLDDFLANKKSRFLRSLFPPDSPTKVISRGYSSAIGSTLTTWFDDPNKESIAEEIGEEIILMKDKDGKILGIEKLNVSLESAQNVQFAVETLPI
jgi:hypothetical protein